MLEQFAHSPFAARLPHRPSEPPYTLATSARVTFIVIQATPDINDASAKRFHLYDERIPTPPKIRPHGRAYEIQCFAHVNVPFVEEHFQFVEGRVTRRLS